MSLFNQTFAVADVRNALLRIVARVGDKHKAQNPGGGSSCTYAVNDNGVLVAVCLIGQWFSDMGLLGLLTYNIPTNSYDSLDLADACAVGSRAWLALEEVGITVDEDAQFYARMAQTGQDSGLTWAAAIKYADAKFLHNKSVEANRLLGIYVDTIEPEVSDFEVPVEPEAPTLADWERELLDA